MKQMWNVYVPHTYNEFAHMLFVCLVADTILFWNVDFYENFQMKALLLNTARFKGIIFRSEWNRIKRKAITNDHSMWHIETFVDRIILCADCSHQCAETTAQNTKKKKPFVMKCKWVRDKNKWMHYIWIVSPRKKLIFIKHIKDLKSVCVVLAS